MNSKEQLLQDLMEIFLIDKRLVEDIFNYAKVISTDDQEAVDIATAKELNKHVYEVLKTVSNAYKRKLYGNYCR